MKLPVEIDPRVAKQDAKNAVRNPIDALIELITNSMDSYNRMKARGEKLPQELDGKIEIWVSKKGKTGIIAVKDWAEGIPADKMEEYIKGYGKRTSGKEKFQSIRGYFGRGLKDAAGGLDGVGEIYSVKDGVISIGIIDGRDKNVITYEPVKTVPATKENLKKYCLDDGGKTIALVKFPLDKVSFPRFDTFAEKLKLCVELRPIMEKGRVTLVRLERGKVIEKRNLKYIPPEGELLLQERKNLIPGTTATYDIEIWRANEDLSQKEMGKFREGGLLIMSGNVVHEATLLTYDNDPNAAKFFGYVKCDYIDELIRKDEAILTPDRQGLNWEHPFMVKLKREIERKLKPLVEKERKLREKKKTGLTSNLIKRSERVGKVLKNIYEKIIREETMDFSVLAGVGDKDSLRKPDGGFDFIPPYYSVEAGKKARLRLLAESPFIPSYEEIEILSTNKNILPKKRIYKVEEGEYIDEINCFKIIIDVMCNIPGEIGEIIAITRNMNGKEIKKKAIVKVEKPIDYPPNGFAFVPSYYRIKHGRTEKITLKIDSHLIIGENIEIFFESNNPYIIVEDKKLTIRKSEEMIIEKTVRIRGERSGVEGKIIAYSADKRLKCEATIKVLSTHPKDSAIGFKIEYDPLENPIQRASFRENTIYIFIKEPTVKLYYGEKGEYADTLSFQVFCADLITDAFCQKVINDLSKHKPFLKDDIEARRNKLNRLKMQYGPLIHKAYVDQRLLNKERGVEN